MRCQHALSCHCRRKHTELAAQPSSSAWLLWSGKGERQAPRTTQHLFYPPALQETFRGHSGNKLPSTGSPQKLLQEQAIKEQQTGEVPSLSLISLSQTCVWGFKCWWRMPFMTAPGLSAPWADGELDQLPLTQPTCSIPTLQGHLRGAWAELTFSDLLC